jgi:chondroitin AC lyase
MDSIKGRIINDLLGAVVNDGQVGGFMNSLSDDGYWPEINYEDLSRTAFENSKHTSRLVSLSRAWRNPASSLYKNPGLLKKIEAALAFWVKNDFICENWWNNEIGTPGDLANTLLLVGDELPVDLVQRTRPIVGRAHLNADGARPSGDRIKIADIYARNLLFFGDEKQFGEVVKVIEEEIKFETGRGMQYDYSFHHRQDRVNNTLSYGLQFADVFAVWAGYVANTRYSFSEEKIKVLVDYYLDGICKMMAFGKYPDLGAKNRSISRSGALRAMGASTPERLQGVTDYRNKELREIIAVRSENAKSTSSYSKFFWHSEYLSHQRPAYFSSVRMHSKRNCNMEVPYNGEGLLSHYLGDGANYVYVNGNEYYNIFPVFDWQKIPGTTILQKAVLVPEENLQKWGLTTFAGAVTDGRYSASAFDFVSPHDATKAKKSWFYFDEEYVCLGSGIASDGNYPVVTTLNQTLLTDEVVVQADGKNSVLPQGEREIRSVRWIYHNGVAYLFPEPTAVHLRNQAQKGSWFTINRQSGISKEEISRDVFKVWIDHGVNPRGQKYEYVVVPGISGKSLSKKLDKTHVETLANSPEIQAVWHKKLQIVQAVFYQPGTLKISGEMSLTAENPCIVMIAFKGNKPVKIAVSDPNRNLESVSFSLSAKVGSNPDMSSEWDEEKKTSRLTVKLPTGIYAGKSKVVQL